MCVCFDKRTLGGPRQTTNGLLRHFVLSSSARLMLGRLLLLFLHRQQVSTSTGVCHGNGFSIRPACCFKLKIYTHTQPYTHWQRLEYFPCLQFSLTEKFDLCGPTLQLGLGSRLRLSLFLCIFIGFVQLSSLDLELVAQILRIRRVARSQQIEFTFPWTYKAHRRPRSNFLRSFLLLLLPLLLVVGSAIVRDQLAPSRCT